jgi:hypothetical protein
MVSIWGNADSINVQKVLWCCEELALPYQRIDAGRHFGVVDTPAFRALNPNGLVPTIDDQGLTTVWSIIDILGDEAQTHRVGGPTRELVRHREAVGRGWEAARAAPGGVGSSVRGGRSGLGPGRGLPVRVRLVRSSKGGARPTDHATP